MDLKDIIRFFLDKPRRFEYTAITLSTAVLMHKIMQDEPGDYIVFDNGGAGYAFTIWDGYPIVKNISTDPEFKRFVHAYQLDGKTTIVSVPHDVTNGYVHWVPVGLAEGTNQC